MGKTQPVKQYTAAALAVSLLAALVQQAAADRWPLINSREGNVLTLILTDCAKYQDWQTVAAAFAWRRSGQGGSMVRVANCNPEDTKNYDKKMLDYVQTHMAPQYAYNEELKDWYAAYNKPGAVVDYFQHNNPKEEWVVVLDSDMLLHKVFSPKELPLDRGWAYAGHYDYLIGTDNALALRHVPEVAPRNDTKAGRLGRRGDRVGGPYYMHRDDLRHLAPQWLNYTRIMRTDMEAYQDSGDTASKKGDRIWIAEMYGYSFGAAKSNVWHIWKEDLMLYPSYTPSAGIPYVLHYGLIYHVNDWTFDKHFYFDFDSHKCPPWDLNVEKPKAGIFPPPPGPANLTGTYINRYKDLISVSVIAIVNAAMCDYHVRHCPPSPQLTEVCNEAFKLFWEVDQAIKDVEWDYGCSDHNEQCKGWAERGKCTKMKAYMEDHCRAACKVCTPKSPRPKTVEDELMTVEILSKEIGKVAAAAEANTIPVVVAAAESPAAQTGQPDKAAEDAAKKHQQEQQEKERKQREQEQKQKEEQEREAAEQKAAEQKAAQQKAAQQKQQHKPDEEAQMRKQYQQSSLGYAALLKRCLDLDGLNDQRIRECVKAASFKLEYPGSLKPEAAFAAAAKDLAGAAADKAKAAAGTAADTAKAATGAAANALKEQINGAAAATNDLASLHAQQYHRRYESLQQQLGRRMSGPSGGWSFVEQSCVVIVFVGVLRLSFNKLQQARRARAKQHGRSD